MSKDSADWDVKDPAAVVTAMTNAIELSYFRALIPIVYESAEKGGLASTDLSKWCVPSVPNSPCFGRFAYPTSAYAYAEYGPNGHTKYVYDITAVGKSPLLYREGNGMQGQDLFINGPFPAALMKQLTDLGLYPAYLFERWLTPMDACASDGSCQ